MTKLAAASEQLWDILQMETEPVAVMLITKGEALEGYSTFERLSKHRYCQALTKARRGHSVWLQPAALSCPAAAAAFGFRPLPAALADGKGLVGFGIVSEEETGRRMFEEMPHLGEGVVAAIAACPLRLAPRMPDAIVLEGPPEALMWLLLADLNVHGGARRLGDTAVLQATCVDSTIIPYLQQRLNFSLGCYGCREATDLAVTETVMGFPGALLDPLLGALQKLNGKAIPRSRAKLAHHCLEVH